MAPLAGGRRSDASGAAVARLADARLTAAETAAFTGRRKRWRRLVPYPTAPDNGRTMSQENVDVVGRTYEAFDRREMYLDVWHPEAEFRPAMAGAVEGKVYRGHSEMRHYLNELFESFSEVLVEDREFRRSEEHTSELQSQSNLVCRLLLEKKKD